MLSLLLQMRSIKAQGVLLVVPNEFRATLNGLIWDAACKDRPFSRPAALWLAYVQQAHHALAMPCIAGKIAVSTPSKLM
jgi:hypothetical protein